MNIKSIVKNILYISITVLLTGLVVFTITNAGSLNPTTSPASTFYTLADIYTRLTTNATATEANHDLSTSNSPAATFYTLSQIYNAIPTIDATKVLTGTSYLGVAGTATAGGFGVAKTGASPSGYSDYTPVVGEDDGSIGTPVSGDHFTSNGDNTTTDNATGLMWISDHIAIGTVGGYNFASTFSWTNAFLAVAALNSANYAGYTNWRLPNVKELQSIIDYSKATGAVIDTTYFPNCQTAAYWSSTTIAWNTPRAWYVGFNSGSVYYTVAKTSSAYVRPVRGGQ